MTLSPLLTELEFTTPQKEAEMGSGPKVSPPPTNVAFKIGTAPKVAPPKCWILSKAPSTIPPNSNSSSEGSQTAERRD